MKDWWKAVPVLKSLESEGGMARDVPECCGEGLRSSGSGKEACVQPVLQRWVTNGTVSEDCSFMEGA